MEPCTGNMMLISLPRFWDGTDEVRLSIVDYEGLNTSTLLVRTVGQQTDLELLALAITRKILKQLAIARTIS